MHGCMCTVQPCMDRDTCNQPCMAEGKLVLIHATSSHAWLGMGTIKPCTAGGGRAQMHVHRPATRGWRRARSSRHAWLETRAIKPPCMAGGRVALMHATSGHAWLGMGTIKPCTAGGGRARMHVHRPATHGWRRARSSRHAWLEAGLHSCMQPPAMHG